MSDFPQPIKRRIIININDWCKEPFEDTDLKHWKQVTEEMLENYDIEILEVKFKDGHE